MKLNETYNVTSDGMQIWWHGTTDQEFKHIHAPSFKNPFFISDDPTEAEMYMHGGYSMDYSKSQLVLVLLEPNSLVTFDWCDQQDLDQIDSIPDIIKNILAFRMKSTFGLIQGMVEMGMFYALGQNDFNDFSNVFKLWVQKINFARADNVVDEDIQQVWNWLSSAKNSKDLFKVRDLSEDINCDIANNVLYELFWYQLEGTKFNSFHEKEMSENIALCDISSIEGVWSRSFSAQEAATLMKKIRNCNEKIYSALIYARTPKEVENVLKILL